MFARAGLTLWDNGWYGGHYLPGYSLLAPALGALVGRAGAARALHVAAAGLFGVIAQRAFSVDGGRGVAGARLAALSFALGACVTMLSGRVAFSLGLAVGLLAVVALERGRASSVAFALAALTSLASPVAGAFLALAGLAVCVGHGGNRAGVVSRSPLRRWRRSCCSRSPSPKAAGSRLRRRCSGPAWRGWR